ncbi:MAG: 4Fe-4S dicluster domain-containing protein [Dehalococcoidales bacterium]|nr:4Fe-4S dicluster domain-containing protein [Dehalococcoidales bacterium]
MRIEVAKDVIEHLRKFPFGFPTSPDNDEWKLLEVPFSLTDEEGKLLCQLKPYSEHIDDIAERLGRSKEEIVPVLDSLLHKTWLLRTGTRENGYYTAMTWGPGASELHMPWLSKELLELYGKMIPPDDKSAPAELIPYFRVVPRESALPYNSEVLPSEIVSHLIEQANEDELAVTECICRKTARIEGKGCSAPIEDQCLFMGGFAVTIVEIGAGRRISKEEAKKRIIRAKELGLVHQASSNARPLVICSCCTCCCAALKSFLGSDQPLSLKSNFRSEINIDICKGTCHDCIKICPAKALTIDKKTQRATVDLSRCIGCGLCAAACPEKAIKLKRKEKPVTYPDAWDDFLRLRLHQSGRDKYFK